MCGIVGAVAQRDVLPILLEGLKRLEYRGYDSAGLAILDRDGKLQRTRVLGKVAELSAATAAEPPVGGTGIAHTRWATHGRPSVDNAHPHVCREQIALVHNGIIENHESMRETLRGEGYEFGSQTDTEVVVNRVHAHRASGRDLLAAVSATVAELDGAYAIGVIDTDEPDRLVAARRGSPLVVGVGIGEHFIASDVFALLPVTRQFIYLEDGDIVDIQRDRLTIYDHTGQVVERPVMTSELAADAVDKAGYRHYMLKEIFSQPVAVADTLTGRIEHGQVLDTAFGMAASDIFSRIEHVHIVACGTSYHAGLVASYWIEALAGLTCRVEIASEYRYRAHVVPENTLFVALSQSGETADTLAALSLARALEYSACLAICNNPESSLTRESDLVFLTRAGPEIGVASTKAFTTQLVALLLLTIALGRRNRIDSELERRLVAELETLPGHINTALQLNDAIGQVAEEFSHKHHALYLGRGTMLPVAMEGALKLKEISYIHAEAYAAGELKHGPLALVDEDMPVIAVAPNNSLLEKLKSNLQEVRARGGVLYLFADSSAGVPAEDAVRVLNLARVPETIAPIVYTIPLQLFAYHIAVIKGADVDQPRNLAKSVTVE
ncbi:glucosamine--fructose-6-phosphate aminotransferase (isomerizing) [Methylohalomonas lacus]|uniref:Glutamine--fructose-6-phosphate aminotransferase [isomerizing] n=1 Tax=Methylohalomonas lacus TaxID=398773 RepID=A0AAE3L5M1_9GAMM|nr:glutamine--fructose-6-phosphate transaminase (isomerizing) [Methylohalomonas lacus]MCS3903537.1 glucosamine--fructose-6-phosphate aminotransferase (isomerizing) [Methylohalomonas lacus]